MNIYLGQYYKLFVARTWYDLQAVLTWFETFFSYGKQC